MAPDSIPPRFNGRLAWACSCKKGGVVSREGTDSARTVLERTVATHLRDRGNEHHGVDVGLWVTSVQLDPEPRPLVWDNGS